MDICDSEFTDEEQTTIIWDNLIVTVPLQDEFFKRLRRKVSRRPYVEVKKILSGVSGYAQSGNLIAIMGPSGAGKTTFLAALARRIELTFGSINVNGRVASREVMSKLSSYMPQFEALPPYLTAEEHLLFVCALKLRTTYTQSKYLSAKLLIDLGLSDSKSTLISRLSGGQKKRLSLATELITRPKILFLDEPTTGLDTFSATRVVESLKTISSNGTIIFCTIHQPGMAIYSLFNNVILMADGRIAYSGNLENATQFFSSLGYVCPVGFDESEYYIKILSVRDREVTPVDLNEGQITSAQCVDKICESFLHSPLSRIPTMTNTGSLVINESTKKAGNILQLRWLMWRVCVKHRRSIFRNWMSWLPYFLSIAAICIFYNGVDPHTQKGVQNARGALYMMSSEIVFTIAYSVLYELPYELPIYIRESSLYGCGPYYIATFLGLVPRAVFEAFLFTTILYFTLNIEDSFCNFLLYCLSTSTAAISSIAYGMMFSSWVLDIEISTAIMAPIDTMFLLTAGILYNLRSLPVYLTFFKYSSIFFYMNEALSIIYWSRIEEIECDANNDLPCLTNGAEVLTEYGFNASNFQWDFVGLIFLALLMNFMGYIGIRRRRRLKTVL